MTKALDVKHVEIPKATRDYTACSPTERLHAPNMDVSSGVAGYPGPAATLREKRSQSFPYPVGRLRPPCVLCDKIPAAAEELKHVNVLNTHTDSSGKPSTSAMCALFPYF